MQKVYTSAAALLLAISGVATTASAQSNPPSSGFFDWGLNSEPAAPDFTAAPQLDNNDASAAQVRNALLASQAAGKPLAVKVIQPLTNPNVLKIFNDFAVQYVFTDFEDAARVGRTRAVADQVLASGKSSNAFVGNFNFYPAAGSDTTRPGALNNGAPSFQIKPTGADYTDSRGRITIGSTVRRGRQIASPALYPGAPDFRNPASGNSAMGTPNIRSALFTLPIQRLTFATNGLLNRAVPGSTSSGYNTPFNGFASGAAQLIPYVTRFNNYGNPALDTDGNPANGYQFVQNEANPADGQLLSRGDFQALILHYRLRGASSVNLFNLSQGSVVGYTDAQEQSDVRTGWGALGTNGGLT